MAQNYFSFRVALSILIFVSVVLTAGQSNLAFADPAFKTPNSATAHSSGPKGAQPLDEATQQALRETQSLLTDPTQRSAAVNADPRARANDQKVQDLLGSDSSKAYKLSSEILEKIVQKTSGDPQAMQTLINELMANPNKLEEYLDTHQREQIRGMASSIEKKKGMAPASPAR